MKNQELASLFSKMADALEIQGEVAFKVLAYRKAARVLEDLTEDIASVAAANRLLSIPGIGKGIAAKIEEYLRTGTINKYEEALAGIPTELLELLEIQGLGAKTVNLLHRELKVKNLADLKRVITEGSLARLPGFGDKKVENLRRGIQAHERIRQRIPIYEATVIAEEVIAYLKKAPSIGRISAAGSLRRMKETVGDIDILASGKDGARISRFFTEFPGARRVLAAGEAKASAVMAIGGIERQVDLRTVDDSAFGAALQHFTGSKAHNIKLRGLAKTRGLKISEYGVFRGRKKVAGRDEEEVYGSLGLSWIPPELREDRGEIELARERKLPAILGYGDVKGDLHVHSKWSDGSQSIRELAETARGLGYEYIAICDHSQSVRYANGLSPERLNRQIQEIDGLNATLKGITILKGAEVDILADGRLDYPDELLRRLDIVMAAIHSGFKKNVTARILKAMENPYVTAIAHPLGRLISGREGYDVDLDAIIEGAKASGKMLELNSYYDRLDLNEFDLKKAREKSIRICLGTDTHSPGGMAMMRFGVGIARRAWLGRDDVLNSLDAARIQRFLRDRQPSSRGG